MLAEMLAEMLAGGIFPLSFLYKLTHTRQQASKHNIGGTTLVRKHHYYQWNIDLSND